MIAQFKPANMDLTRYIFFTGKGGVGKTSAACATAVAPADAGKRVLIVSTDPALKSVLVGWQIKEPIGWENLKSLAV